jgi:glutathione peroxidase-family protein
MRRVLGLLLMTLLFWSCTNKNDVAIKGKYVAGAGETINLEMLNIASTQLMDSAEVKGNGTFKMNFDLKNPELVLLKNEKGQYINILAFPGDKINIDITGKYTTDYSIEGSEISEDIKMLVCSVEDAKTKLDSILEQINALEDLESPEADVLVSAYRKVFEKQKRSNIKYIIENLSSPASVYALYQRLSPELYIFNEVKDLQYFKLVADSLKVKYPNSTLTTSLVADINERMSRYNNMIAMNKLSEKNVQEAGYIDLEIENPEGKQVKLSSLQGKVILVNFWASWNEESIQSNKILQGVYNKYHQRGFEVYSISMDNNRNTWRSSIDFEEYKWINVSELSYPNSSAALSYNVQGLPTTYLIDREGNIVAKNLNGTQLATWLDNLL